MSIASSESSRTLPYDVAMATGQVADGAEQAHAKMQRVAEMLAILDDPSNVSVNRLLQDKSNPARSRFLVSWQVLQVVMNPGPGNQRIIVDTDEEIQKIQSFLSGVSAQLAEGSASAEIAAQNQGRLGAIRRYARRVSLSLFS